jgi:hypothetical protein
MRSRSVVVFIVGAVVGGGGAGVIASASDDPSGTSAQATEFRQALFGSMRGVNELDSEGHKGAGDLNGRGAGSGVYDPDTGELCFGITVKDIGDPVAAHIHRGKRGQEGPPVVTLVPPAEGDPGASSGCVLVDAALAREITTKPQRFYWNVHTPEFPDGAVRGQVFTKKK